MRSASVAGDAPFAIVSELSSLAGAVSFTRFRDVTLRDGFQDERFVPTETKVEVFDALVAAGITDLELTSFVRPDRVPAMADAEALCAATSRPGVTRWGLVLNPRGAQRALAAGLDHLQYVVSVSDTHSRRNAGVGTDGAMCGLVEVSSIAAANGAAVEVTLATAFGCPFEGRVNPGRVVTLAAQSADLGASSIGLADTIGVAVPTEVRSLLDAARAAIDLPIGVHLHDTRGLGIANALAAIDAGADRVDGSVGGLGGCPFAPGASGNLALEDLVHALEEMGMATGLSVAGLAAAAAVACRAVDLPIASHVGVAGPRFPTSAAAQHVCAAPSQEHQDVSDSRDDAIAVADRFFAAIAGGDATTVRELYDPRAVVWHNNDGLEQGVDPNLEVLGWCMTNIGRMRYEDVRRQRTAAGFIQQHVLRGTAPNGSELEVPTCLIVEVAGGRITRIDEYMDSAHIQALTS